MGGETRNAIKRNARRGGPLKPRAGASSRTQEERGLGTAASASALRAEISCVTTRTIRRRRRLPRRRAVPVPLGAVLGVLGTAWGRGCRALYASFS